MASNLTKKDKMFPKDYKAAQKYFHKWQSNLKLIQKHLFLWLEIVPDSDICVHCKNMGGAGTILS